MGGVYALNAVAIESGALRAGPRCQAKEFAAIRRKTILEGCKWDPQVEDIATLADFPLILKRSVWRELAVIAERLTSEMFAAEAEILERPKLMEALGLPKAVLNALRDSGKLAATALRVVRFDFHPTKEGWKISEANSDVPGGYSEGSFFTRLMAEQFSEYEMAGNPGDSWADAFTAKVGRGGIVALLSAPGYMEDHQVVAFQAKLLRERGVEAVLCNPRQITWREGKAGFNFTSQPIDGIARFFQSEWMARFFENDDWKNYFRGSVTPIANPGFAVITESKRFPLVWDDLSTALPVWRAMLPETRDPREVPWERDESWLLKSALCDTGDTVSIRAMMKNLDWARVFLSARLMPNRWVAQRRFESIPIDTPEGFRHACVGIYTINGQAVGAYARLATKPLINFMAVDAAMLVDHDE